MNDEFSLEGSIHIQPVPCENSPPPLMERVPRVAKLLALAIRWENLLRAGVIPDEATLARLGHVSRARISQIMNLRFLAPDIQEELLFAKLDSPGRDSIHVRHLQPIAIASDWKIQRRLWRSLRQRLWPQSPGST